MKRLLISAAGLLALGVAACSPAGENESQTSPAASDTAADTGTMAPSEGSIAQPSDGSMTGNTGTTSTGATSGGNMGTNPDGSPMSQSPDDQTNGTGTGTAGNTPPVQ